MEVIQAVRSALPNPAPEAGIAHLHQLAEHGSSQRAIARQLGLHRETVKEWLRRVPPNEVHESFSQVWHDRTAPNSDDLRRAAHEAKQRRVLELRQQGLSYSAIAREVGLHRVTVKQWLLNSAAELATPEAFPNTPKETSCPIPPQTPAAEAETHSQPLGVMDVLRGNAAPPPPPWQDWDQIRHVREALREHRFLLMRRPEHLDSEQQAIVADLLTSPLSELSTARRFLLGWYDIWKDEGGHRRTVEEATARHRAWRSDPLYLATPALRLALARMTDARFEQLSPFLRHPR